MITLLMSIFLLTFGKNIDEKQSDKLMNIAISIDIIGIVITTLVLLKSVS